MISMWAVVESGGLEFDTALTVGGYSGKYG